MDNKRIFGLDLLRFIAILLVLINHTFELLTKNPLWLSIFYYCGLAGVEIFFVLSGFLIGTILIKTHNLQPVTGFNSIKTFWVRRWFRTLPNYYLTIILLDLLYYTSYHGPVISLHSRVSYLFFFQNFASQMPDTVFQTSWSLSIEEWFYLLFPLILFGIQYLIKSKAKSILTLTIIFIIVPLILRLIASGTGVSINFDNGYRKIVLLRLDSIGFGVLMAYLQFYYPRLITNKKVILFITGIICWLSLIVWFCFFNNSPFFQNTLFFTAFSLSIMLTVPLLNSLKPAGRFRWLVLPVTLISVISYSIYLIHPIIIFIVTLLIEKFNFSINAYLIVCLIWVVTITYSYLQYNFFEVKMTKLRDKFGDKKSIKHV